MASANRCAALAAGALWIGLSSGPAALADDTDLFVSHAQGDAAAPNVLFVFDTSGSMDTAVESQSGYDPATVYDGACDASRAYWREGTGDPPACDTDRWIAVSALQCDAARDAFESGGGRLTDRFARFDSTDATWKSLDAPTALDGPSSSNAPLECEDDGGVHGAGRGAPAVYAREGVADAPWSEHAEDEINWQSRALATLYDGNYLNWYYGPVQTSTRMHVMKDVAKGLVAGVGGVNLGVMRYNATEGGTLVHEVADVGEHRDSMLAAIDALTPSGFSPLAETMYEAAAYFAGAPPYYSESGVGVVDGAYRSPVELACQKSYIVYLTDGEPNRDDGAADLVSDLPGFADVVGTSCADSGDGACFTDLARYLHETDLDPSLPGQQNVSTYTIGFALDLPLLSEAAAAGGGEYYTADDTASLTQVLTNIVTSILETPATFTAPAVGIDSFNRARHSNDVFVTLFQPTGNAHWPGNLKKYRLRPDDGAIVDVNGRPAVDEDGFFAPDAQSAWSIQPDGRSVTRGGAASRLPQPNERRVYTYLAGQDLTSAANAVDRGNTHLTDALLGLGDPDDPSRDDVIDFIRGFDVGDADGDGSRTDGRGQIGDPLHSSPVSVVYGGTPGNPDADDSLVLFATNDGLLHAVDPSTGIEQWAFVPPEFLDDQADLLADPAVTAKRYGIDGNLRVQVLTENDDGVIDASAGERVYLYFGLRRGGRVYYGLDITNPDRPRLLWRLDGDDLAGLGQTWSTPVPTHVDIQGAGQNDARAVVVFAGGYDETQDNHAPSTDEVGNAIYIVDSVSGNVLWHGGRSGATRNFADMRYSVPADVKVVDLDGDGLADRFYTADMGGQLWRFDVFNGKPASGLVAGGVIARLGAAATSTPTEADARRFYYAPDVALATSGGRTFMHIGIGSGYRAHPNSTENDDRFYAIRDDEPFRHLDQPEFDSRPIVTEDDLVDVTDEFDAIVEAGSAGWMLRLASGEKVLAEARTFDNDVYFTTFTPGAESENPCEPRVGTNKLYVVSLLEGAPANTLDRSVDDEPIGPGTGDQPADAAVRSTEFAGSIGSGVSFLFPSAEDAQGCVGDECAPLPVVCVDLFCRPAGFGNSPIRTYWRQENVD